MLNAESQLLDPTREDNAVENFFVPQAVLTFLAAARLGPLCIVMLAVLPLMVRTRWLLLHWIAIAFVNFALFAPELSWVGLLPTYYFGAVVAYRLGVFDHGLEHALSRARFELLGVAIIGVSYLLVTRGKYWQQTGLKSSIQLVFLLLLAAVSRQIPVAHFQTLRAQLKTVFPRYLIGYALLGLVLWKAAAAGERFDGMLGAQVFAFELTLLFAFYWFAEERRSALLCLLLIAVTGSRTYAGAAILVVFLPVITRKTSAINRIVAVTALTGFVVLGAALLPMISSRFVMNDDFYGSFLGRLMNYWNAADHIRASPIFGEGMGSMLQVLEDWIPDLFEYYRVSGDTTIVHDEYLRILMELGAVGGVMTVLYLRSILRVPSPEARTLMLIILVGSLTENTLAAYSTAIITITLLVRSAIVAVRQAPVTA